MPHSTRTPTGRLIDTAGIAELIGRSRQRAAQITRDPGFPAPLDVLSMGPVWWRADVEAYLERRPADRRVREVRVREGRSRAA